MYKYRLPVLTICLLVLPALRADTPERVLLDEWNSAYLAGAKAGYVRTTVHEFRTPDGSKLLRTTTELNLTLRRNQSALTLRMQTGTEERGDGKVTGVFMRQFQGGDEQLTLQGTVRDHQLQVRVQGSAQQEKAIPWNDEVLGLYRQEKLYQERNVRPGDRFSYLSYEPTINTVVHNHVLVKDYEDTEVLGARKR